MDYLNYTVLSLVILFLFITAIFYWVTFKSTKKSVTKDISNEILFNKDSNYSEAYFNLKKHKDDDIHINLDEMEYDSNGDKKIHFNINH